MKLYIYIYINVEKRIGCFATFRAKWSVCDVDVGGEVCTFFNLPTLFRTEIYHPDRGFYGDCKFALTFRPWLLHRRYIYIYIVHNEKRVATRYLQRKNYRRNVPHNLHKTRVIFSPRYSLRRRNWTFLLFIGEPFHAYVTRIRIPDFPVTNKSKIFVLTVFSLKKKIKNFHLKMRTTYIIRKTNKKRGRYPSRGPAR